MVWRRRVPETPTTPARRPPYGARVCWALVHGLADLLVAGQLGGTARAPAEIDRLARHMTATLVDGLAAGRDAGAGEGH